MKEYIFVFGRDPGLSLLELKAYLTARDIKFNLIFSSDHGVVLEAEKLNHQKIIKDLGGTAKIAKVVNLDNIELYTGTKHKVKYGISSYDADDEDIRDYLKKRLKKEKLKAMIKQPKRKETFLSPSESQQLDFEIIVFPQHIGKVISVFDPKAYKERDTNRPIQRPLHTISIRLAKILINLTGAKEKDTILDPFCGIGVLLQEALLMNMNVFGLDINGKCVNDSIRNLEWTKNRFKLQRRFIVKKGDSRHLHNYVRKVNAVATEPYMGPFMKKLPTEEKAKEIVKKLTPMYSDLLKEMKRVVKGKIAIVVPRFRLYQGKRIKIPFKRLLEKHGYTHDKEFPITYVAVKSKMEREIWVIKKG